MKIKKFKNVGLFFATLSSFTLSSQAMNSNMYNNLNMYNGLANNNCMNNYSINSNCNNAFNNSGRNSMHSNSTNINNSCMNINNSCMNINNSCMNSSNMNGNFSSLYNNNMSNNSNNFYGNNSGNFLSNSFSGSNINANKRSNQSMNNMNGNNMNTSYSFSNGCNNMSNSMMNMNGGFNNSYNSSYGSNFYNNNNFNNGFNNNFNNNFNNGFNNIGVNYNFNNNLNRSFSGNNSNANFRSNIFANNFMMNNNMLGLFNRFLNEMGINRMRSNSCPNVMNPMNFMKPAQQNITQTTPGGYSTSVYDFETLRIQIINMSENVGQAALQKAEEIRTNFENRVINKINEQTGMTLYRDVLKLREIAVIYLDYAKEIEELKRTIREIRESFKDYAEETYRKIYKQNYIKEGGQPPELMELKRIIAKMQDKHVTNIHDMITNSRDYWLREKIEKLKKERENYKFSNNNNYLSSQYSENMQKSEIGRIKEELTVIMNNIKDLEDDITRFNNQFDTDLKSFSSPRRAMNKYVDENSIGRIDKEYVIREYNDIQKNFDDFIKKDYQLTNKKLTWGDLCHTEMLLQQVLTRTSILNESVLTTEVVEQLQEVINAYTNLIRKQIILDCLTNLATLQCVTDFKNSNSRELIRGKEIEHKFINRYTLKMPDLLNKMTQHTQNELINILEGKN